MSDHEQTHIEQAQEAPQEPRSSSKLAEVTMGTRGVHLATMDDAWRFAQAAIASGLVPAAFKTPQEVLIAMQMGAEVGMLPMTSLRSITVIDGTPTIWGDAMLALCEASGKLSDIQEWWEGSREDNTLTAFCRVKRRTRASSTTRSFGMEDAQRAGLLSKKGFVWKGYDWRMLQMRARGFALRDTFPEFLGGYMLTEDAMARQVLQGIEAEDEPHTERMRRALEERMAATPAEVAPDDGAPEDAGATASDGGGA